MRSFSERESPSSALHRRSPRRFALVDEVRPDVTLVDIDLGAESGFDLASRLARAADGEPSRAILISTHAEADFADLIDASPAVGFLSKSDLSAEAIDAILSASPER